MFKFILYWFRMKKAKYLYRKVKEEQKAIQDA